MKKLIITIGIAPLVAILGAILTEYILQIGVLGTDNLKYFLIVGVILSAAVYYFSRSKAYGVSAFIGALLIPYFVFAIGQMDIYMVDDNLAEGITVLECRPTMEGIYFGTANGEKAVWQGPQTMKLHPGENRVKLGRFNMEKDIYKGGRAVIGNIQVDIQADFTQMKSPDGSAIPSDQYDMVFNTMKTNMGLGSKLVSAERNGDKAIFTIEVGKMEQQLPIPEINYPGMGGPDITLDITLGADGRPDPSKIKAVVDMPPGVGGAFPTMPGVEFR